MLSILLLSLSLESAGPSDSSPPRPQSPNVPTSAGATKRDLFPKGFSTREQTPTVTSRQIQKGRDLFQVFFSRETKREIFRVHVGHNKAQWWRYGVAFEGDVNSDGKPDYSWHGGDDTSDVRYVFLSKPDGKYARLDIYRTAKRWWSRHQANQQSLADLDMADGPCYLEQATLIRNDGRLILELEITFYYPEIVRQNVRIPESEFVMT